MRKRIVIALGLVVLGGALWWRSQPERTQPTEPASERTVATVPAPANGLKQVATAAPEVPEMSSVELARVVAENARPGRMVFVDFVFTPERIAAVRAEGAAGRAKVSGPRHGAGWLHYDVFSPTQMRTLTGAVPDPLRQRFEYEDETLPGALRSTVVARERGVLALRLPGEADAARVVFYRETAAAGGRELVGAVTLR
ncbi:MAG: hypothetical protein HZA31_11375 [Opitutae bacterium]|nr:hypothetical protein [Opitutae bacterium]